MVTFDFEEWEGSYTFYKADLYHKTKRIVDLLEASRIPATFFLDGYTTLRYPEAVQLLSEKGFELSLHSDYHPGAVRNTGNRKRAESVGVSDFRQDSETQVTRIRRGISMVRQVVPSFDPKGFRAPCLLWNKALYESLRKLNFQYDSSQKVNTFQPFTVNSITVLPVNSSDYDSACYKMRLQYVLAVWKERFAKACEISGSSSSCFIILAHPSVSGKRRYIGLLKAMLSHMSWQGAQYCTCQEFAALWRENGPTEENRVETAQGPQMGDFVPMQSGDHEGAV